MVNISDEKNELNPKTLDTVQEALAQTKKIERDMQNLLVQAKKLQREEQIEKAQKRLQTL